MSDKLPADTGVLLGFSDFGDFFDDVFVGAGPQMAPAGAGPQMAGPQTNVLQRRPVVAPKNLPANLPAGAPRANVVEFKKVPVRKAKPSKAAAPQKTALVSTIDAGKRLIDAGKKAEARAKADQAKIKSGKRAPLVPVRPTAVRGDGTVVLGAVLPKGLTPKQKTAVQKHVQAVAKNVAATRRLAALAQKAQKVGGGALTFSQKAALDLKKAAAPKWRTGPTTVGDYYACIGAEPDPNNPGFLTDGSLDPAMVDPSMADPSMFDPYATTPDPAAAQDDATGPVYGPDGTLLYDPNTDPMITPVPVRGQALTPDEAQVTFEKVPEDGVVYNGARGLPVNCIGSWNVFYGSQKGPEGFGIPGFLRGSLDGGNLIQWVYNAPEFGDASFRVAPRTFQTAATSGAPDAAAVQANSLQRGWGPVIGNPRDPFFANLQYATADKAYFWQGKCAPRAATAEIDMKIEQANAKVRSANRTAALLRAAQMTKDLLDMQEAQAKQDAANALAQSAADTQSDIVRKQLEAQQAQLDMQQQQADMQTSVQQQQLDMQLAQQQAQMDAQMQQMQLQMMQQQAQQEAAAQAALIEQAQIWNEYARANPQEAMAQMQPQGEAPMLPGGYGGEPMEPDFSDGNAGASSAQYDPFAEITSAYEGSGYHGSYDGGSYDFGDGSEDESAESAEGD